MCALLLNPLYMKKAFLLLALVVTGSLFADTSGIAATRHYTVRTKNTVCAIDVVVLASGKIMTEKSCFKF